jgi:hypothetical protein
MNRRLVGSAFAAVVVVSALAIPAARSTGEAAPSGDVVRTWNSHALHAVRTTNSSDAQAARLYAMVNAAMFDAVNALEPAAQRREAAIVAPAPGSSGDPVAAAASAAHDILVAFHPAGASTYDTQLASDVESVRSTGQAEHGRELGSRVAAAVLDARTNDGSSPNETQPAGTGVGEFRLDWPGAQFRRLEPFAIDNSAGYVGDGPPALTSPEYAAAFDEVKFVGDAARPDPAALATFRFWSLGGRTSQPPGAWVQIAGIISSDRVLSLTDTTRLFALQSLAMADTVAPTYETKHAYHFWRPQTAIREAHLDGNDATVAESTWSPRAGGPGTSPEHTSGHSSFSAAGAAAIAGFFCTDDIPFAFVSDSANGEVRSYPSLSAAAAEAGRSRILGGIHFEFSNTAGLDAGRAIANEVLTTALRPVNGSVPNADCAA